MDKNTIIGLVIIALILVGYSYFMQPSKEEIRAMEIRDSIARVEARQRAEAEKQRQEAYELAQSQKQEAISSVFRQDSLQEQTFTLENNKIKLRIDSKGGRVSHVELKDYRTHDSLPLVLWQEKTSEMYLSFYALNRQINTNELIFVPGEGNTGFSADSTRQLTMRAYVEDDKYLEFTYRLAPDTYMVDFSINAHNLNDIIASNTNFLTLHWDVEMPQLEKSKEFENRYTGVYYNFTDGEVESLSPAQEGDTAPNRTRFAELQSKISALSSEYAASQLYVYQRGSYMPVEDFIAEYTSSNANVADDQDYAGEIPDTVYSPYLAVVERIKTSL